MSSMFEFSPCVFVSKIKLFFSLFFRRKDNEITMFKYILSDNVLQDIEFLARSKSLVI